MRAPIAGYAHRPHVPFVPPSADPGQGGLHWGGLSRLPLGALLPCKVLPIPPRAAVRYGLTDRRRVKVVARLLGQQEDILVALGTAVPHALRQPVGLGPDDVLPKIPAVRPQGKGQLPGHADQVLVFVAPRRMLRRMTAGITSVRRRLTARFGRVAVPYDHPQGPIGAQHPPHLAKYRHQSVNVLRHGVLCPNLSRGAVVPQIVIGRRRDAGVYALIRQLPQPLQRIPHQDLLTHGAPPLPRRCPRCARTALPGSQHAVCSPPAPASLSSLPGAPGYGIGPPCGRAA